MKLAARAARTMPPPILDFRARLAAGPPHPDPIDLGQAIPSWGPPEVARRALAVAADDATAFRYSVDPGRIEVREAVAAWLGRRHGAALDAGQLVLTPGANAAFHFVANVLFDPGEDVHVATPWYFNHPMSIGLLGGRPVPVPLPLATPLAEAIAGGALDAVRPGGTFVLVNPGNPTGRAYGPADVAALFAWASARDVRLVLDETYLDFFPEGTGPATILAEVDWPRRAVAIGSFSKALAMTGWRIGWVAAAPEVVAEVLKVQDSAAVCAPHPVQLAVAAALGDPATDDWMAASRAEIGRRVAAFTHELRAAGGRFAVEAQGAFFAWVRETPEARGSAPAAAADLALRVARETGAVGLPGDAFGPGLGDRIRIAVGNAGPDRLREAARRMAGMR